MAYYDALIAKWPSLAGPSTQQKLAQLNALSVAVPQPALLSPNAVFNAIALADYKGLLQLQQAQLNNLLMAGAGGQIDASLGTLVRNWFGDAFAGKASLTALQALVTPYDSGTNNMQPWTLVKGYSQTMGQPDLDACFAATGTRLT